MHMACVCAQLSDDQDHVLERAALWMEVERVITKVRLIWRKRKLHFARLEVVFLSRVLHL